MRVLVCGGRDYFDAIRVDTVLDHVVTPSVVIQGGARGADAMAANWAAKRGIEMLCYKANWHYHGKRAGIVRNEWMLEDGKPDIVVAFPGGRGTAHMVSIAKLAGVPVIEVPG